MKILKNEKAPGEDEIVSGCLKKEGKKVNSLTP